MAYQTHTLHTLDAIQTARSSGPLRAWDTVLHADPFATFFQTQEWCLNWYAAYSDVCTPLFVFLTGDSGLVGFAALTVELETRRLHFAGLSMSDYRDVVALPSAREAVISAVLAVHRNGKFSDPFLIGFTQPDSSTVPMLHALDGVRLIERSHPCYRYYFDAPNPGKRFVKRESVRRNLNHFRRRGEVRLERVIDNEGWKTIRETFYQHHNLRQISAGRPVSFTNPRKRAFYDLLFRNAPERVHLTVLRVDDQVVAEHFGFLWKGLIYFGAPAFDLRDNRRSPVQVLLALMLEQARDDGLRGLDLTIGPTQFKSRIGNEQVTLPSAEVYSHRLPFLARLIRVQGARGLKLLLASLFGPKFFDATKATWNKTRKSLGRIASPRKRLEPSMRFIVGGNTPQVEWSFGDRPRWRVNDVSDLLKWSGSENERALLIRESLDRFHGGEEFHSAVRDGDLTFAAWAKTTQLPAEEDSPSQEAVCIRPVSEIVEKCDPDELRSLLSEFAARLAKGNGVAVLVECGFRDRNARRAAHSLGFRAI